MQPTVQDIATIAKIRDLTARAASGDPEAQAELDRMQGGLGQASQAVAPQERRPFVPESMPSRKEYDKQFGWLSDLMQHMPGLPTKDELYAREKRDIGESNRVGAQRDITQYASGGYASGGASHQCPFCGK